MVRMGHNYSKYSDNKKKTKLHYTDAVIREPVIIDDSHEEVVKVEEVMNAIAETATTGVVTGCMKLNVRENPNTDSNILAVINEGDEVTIDVNASTTEDFYKITTATGLEGYCMKSYIVLKDMIYTV